MRFSRTAWRACFGAVAACLVLVAFSGCGAGVVGTGSGTDDDGDGDIRYTPGAVCKSPFAEASLACLSDGKDPSRGTAAVTWADANKSNGSASVLAALEGNSMSIQAPCSELTFLGNWGSLEDGTLAFVGRYLSPQAPAGRPAIALVLPAPNEPDAVGWLQVMDSSGSTLFGPWLVRRVDGRVRFAECVP
jgi:hypothetical protein